MKYCYLFLLLIVTFSCNSGKGDTAPGENPEDRVTPVESDDPDMNKAIRTARASFPEFLKTVALADERNEEINVKCRFAYPGGFEHMWLNRLYYKGDTLMGLLNNDPQYFPDWKAGDARVIHTDSVSDWMYIRDSVLIGGYTTRVLISRMSAAEKKEQQKRVPYRIE